MDQISGDHGKMTMLVQFVNFIYNIVITIHMNIHRRTGEEKAAGGQ